MRLFYKPIGTSSGYINHYVTWKSPYSNVRMVATYDRWSITMIRLTERVHGLAWRMKETSMGRGIGMGIGMGPFTLMTIRPGGVLRTGRGFHQSNRLYIYDKVYFKQCLSIPWHSHARSLRLITYVTYFLISVFGVGILCSFKKMLWFMNGVDDA